MTGNFVGGSIRARWGEIDGEAENGRAIIAILKTLRKHGPMREKELRAEANVSSIGAVYKQLRDEYGVGRLYDPDHWPDDDDKLYFLPNTVDPEWAFQEMTRGFRRQDAAIGRSSLK